MLVSCGTTKSTSSHTQSELRTVLDSLHTELNRQFSQYRKERTDLSITSDKRDTVLIERYKEVVLNASGDTLKSKEKSQERSTSQQKDGTVYVREVVDSAALLELLSMQRELRNELASLKEDKTVEPLQDSFLERIKKSTWWYLLCYSLLLTTIIGIYIKRKVNGKAH